MYRWRPRQHQAAAQPGERSVRGVDRPPSRWPPIPPPPARWGAARLSCCGGAAPPAARGAVRPASVEPRLRLKVTSAAAGKMCPGAWLPAAATAAAAAAAAAVAA